MRQLFANFGNMHYNSLTMKHTDSITSIVSGSISLSAEARRIGVNPAILHRELKKHPDYEAAKADGRIRKPGIATDRLTDVPKGHPAIAEVLAGGSVSDACRRHNLTPGALKKAVIQADGDVAVETKHAQKPARGAESEIRAATQAVQRTLLAHQNALERLAELTMSQ